MDIIAVFFDGLMYIRDTCWMIQLVGQKADAVRSIAFKVCLMVVVNVSIKVRS